MAKVIIAIGLLVASLVLLVIYGADAAAAGSNSNHRGFLPIDEAVRGGGLGGGAVIMSIIGFVLARKQPSKVVMALLFINGGLIIAGMIALIAQGALASENSSGAMRTIGSTIGLGAILMGLGAWKAASDRRVASKPKASR